MKTIKELDKCMPEEAKQGYLECKKDVLELIDELEFEFDINEGDDEGMCLMIKDGVLDKPKPIKLIKAEELKARIRGDHDKCSEKFENGK